MVIPSATWKDLHERALIDPLVHYGVALVERHGEDRETVLIALVLALSDANAQQRTRMLELLSRRTWST